MKRAAFITGTIVLVAAVAALSTLLARERSRLSEAHRKEATLRGQIVQARASASSFYQRGIKFASTIQKDSGNTYAKGFAAGWKGVFAGYDEWVDGNWYLIRIEHASRGHNIASRVDVTPCERMYESNDEIYTQGQAC